MFAHDEVNTDDNHENKIRKRRLTADIGLHRLRKIFVKYRLFCVIQSLKDALISCSKIRSRSLAQDKAVTIQNQ